MVIRIDQMDRMPVYQQIRNQIVAAIGRGELYPADRLPSVRLLASDLDINIHIWGANKLCYDHRFYLE